MATREQSEDPGLRVDERDTMFARAARRPGTPAYQDYYHRHPELQAVDDKLRGLPPLCQPGGRFFDAPVCAEAQAQFDAIENERADPTQVEHWRSRLELDGDPATALLGMSRALGAVAAGCAALEPWQVYSHKGRFDADYGRPIEPAHRSALVFLVEMEFAAMQRAPRAEVLVESARQYRRAAAIARIIEATLLAAGIDARAHYDAHYEVLLVPLAIAAGLGELGRHNLLIADRFGTRVRIGAVTMDLALPPARPISLGVGRFCERCRKCARSCPSHALSMGPREPVRGVMKWSTQVERCYGYWRSVGSDCGICMAVCPFSHRSSLPHQLVRGALRRAPWLARPALWGDDLLYGRRWKIDAR